MKRALWRGLLTGVLLCLTVMQPATGYAAQWVGTERVWDDGRLQPNETFTWTGGHDRDGSASGTGVLQWYADGKLGNRYEGNMSKGRIAGMGVCIFANGNRYEGDWVDGKRYGKGVFTWANGSRYEGDFVRDQRTGKGVMIYANGDRYEGDWVDGWRTGKGIMAYANGDRYEGDWREDKKLGRGTMILADGRRQEGKWDVGYAGPPESPLNFVLIFAAIAGAAGWTIRQATREGRLSGLGLAKQIGCCTLLAFVSAIIVKFDVVGQFIFDWEFYGFGAGNTAVLFLVVGVVSAAALRWTDKEQASWCRVGAFGGLYGAFTLLLWAVWYAYSFFFAFFIFSLGGR